MSRQNIVLAGMAAAISALIVTVHDQRALAVTFLVALGLLSSGFAVTYAVWSPWRVTVLGRAMLFLASSFGVLAWWIVLGWFWRDLPGRDTIRSVLYGTLLMGWLWLCLILLRTQRDARAGGTIEDLWDFEERAG